MDLWSLGQKHILNIPPLNYSLVGRWILWIPRGKLSHRTIVSTSPVRGEIFTGWAFHYLTGLLFASVPIMLNGSAWFHEPSLLTGLLTGLLTLPAPLMILQPAFGFGIAASRTPRPWLARLLSLLTHLIYGVGLYSSTTVLLSFSQH
ncbi:DUF2938 family protein [Leminorella richardii]|nr:DUF2938 family protein [Leminorella richardii]